MFASRKVDNPGFLVQKWDDLSRSIGNEVPEKCSMTGGEVNCSKK